MTIHTEVPGWPEPLERAAFHGPLGTIINTVAPHTEADPAALMFQMIAAIGNAIGRGPYFRVEADRHHTNLFVAMVGKSAKARKGTSWKYVERALEDADPNWVANRIQNGLASGEGLIYAVQDTMADKRLMVVEPEFAKVLTVGGRDGNTLTATIRMAWDSGNLRVMTKNNPLMATDAHISIIGHVTEDDLREHLKSKDVSNGFANRFLWVAARRARLLPEGGSLPSDTWTDIRQTLKDTVCWARTQAGEMIRDEEARRRWIEAYPTLSAEHEGPYGVITSRAEAQCVRLAMIYALLDQTATIGAEHLQAAFAIWKYADASAKFIFGRDVIGEEIRALLVRKPRGVTKTGVFGLFSNNVDSRRLDAALLQIELDGDLYRRTQGTTGRPAEYFVPTKRLLDRYPANNEPDAA